MKKNIITIAVLVLITTFFYVSMTKVPQDHINKTNFNNNPSGVYAIKIPQNLDFAKEEVPLYNPDIYERMDRELLVNTFWQSNALLMFKRTQKYFPIIEPILKKEGIPDDFKYLAVIESGLSNVVSPAGASGFWQIMESTGKENGLEINENVDERYNLIKSTELACKYLKQAKAKLGSWTLAAAAYNGGMNGMARRLKEQNVNSYYDLLLGEETGRYVFRIIALKEILNNPKKYGYNIQDDDLYRHLPTYTVKVDTAITNFTSFAQKFNINYKILKIHNPWLRQAYLNNKTNIVYQIEIPQAGTYKLNH